MRKLAVIKKSVYVVLFERHINKGGTTKTSVPYWMTEVFLCTLAEKPHLGSLERILY